LHRIVPQNPPGLFSQVSALIHKLRGSRRWDTRSPNLGLVGRPSQLRDVHLLNNLHTTHNSCAAKGATSTRCCQRPPAPPPD
jgi:hypothetical protein